MAGYLCWVSQTIRCCRCPQLNGYCLKYTEWALSSYQRSKGWKQKLPLKEGESSLDLPAHGKLFPLKSRRLYSLHHKCGVHEVSAICTWVCVIPSLALYMFLIKTVWLISMAFFVTVVCEQPKNPKQEGMVGGIWEGNKERWHSLKAWTSSHLPGLKLSRICPPDKMVVE